MALVSSAQNASAAGRRADVALRDLLGRMPLAVIAGERHLQRAERRVARVLAPHGFVLEVLGQLPRAVVGFPLAGDREIAARQTGGAAERRALPAVLAAFEREERFVEPFDGRHVRRARQREVADVRAIGALAVVHALDHFGDQPVQVEVTLAVAVRAQVHRHVVDVGREVGAVVEVEAAQEVLVRLAAARVLGGDQAGDDFEQLGHAEQGAHGQVGAADGALARRGRLADEVLAAAKMTTSCIGPLGGVLRGCRPLQAPARRRPRPPGSARARHRAGASRRGENRTGQRATVERIRHFRGQRGRGPAPVGTGRPQACPRLGEALSPQNCWVTCPER